MTRAEADARFTALNEVPYQEQAKHFMNVGAPARLKQKIASKESGARRAGCPRVNGERAPPRAPRARAARPLKINLRRQVFWNHPTIDFANDGEKRENLWKYCARFVELDTAAGAGGHDLDEFAAHRFLEKAIKPMTIKELRSELDGIDIDDNKRMSLLEFLVFHHEGASFEALAEYVPSGSPAALALVAAAEAEMVKVKGALEAVTAAAAAAKESADAARGTSAIAKKAAADAAAAADASARAAAALVAEEKAKADAIDAQAVLSTDDSLSTVKRNRAVAQLAILRAEDSQPLRTARITASAAERAARKAAAAATSAAADSANAEGAARSAADAAKAKIAEAHAAVAATATRIEEAKEGAAGSGGADGTFWWLAVWNPNRFKIPST